MFRILSCIVLLSSVTAAFADTSDEIQSTVENFKVAFDDGNAQEVAEFYTPDAVSHSPGWRPVSGREGIANMYAAFFKAGFSNLTWETQSITEIGEDAAVEVRHDWTQRTDTKGNVTDHGFKVISVWRKGDDGAWRISHDSFNDLPGG